MRQAKTSPQGFQPAGLISERRQGQRSRQLNGCYRRTAYSGIGHSGKVPSSHHQTPNYHQPNVVGRTSARSKVRWELARSLWVPPFHLGHCHAA